MILSPSKTLISSTAGDGLQPAAAQSAAAAKWQPYAAAAERRSSAAESDCQVANGSAFFDGPFAAAAYRF